HAPPTHHTPPRPTAQRMEGPDAGAPNAGSGPRKQEWTLNSPAAEQPPRRQSADRDPKRNTPQPAAPAPAPAPRFRVLARWRPDRSSGGSHGRPHGSPAGRDPPHGLLVGSPDIGRHGVDAVIFPGVD